MTEPAPAPMAAPALTRNPMAMILGLVGAALIIAGTFLDWLKQVPSPGTDADISIFWDFESTTVDPSFFASAGFVTVVIGAIVLLGAVLHRAGIVLIGGILAVLAWVLVNISFYRVEVIDLGIGDNDIGLWAILAGGVVAIVAGLVDRRASA